MNRVELDVNAGRAALQGCRASLQTDHLGVLPFDLLVLDTGQAFDLCVPESFVALPEHFTRTTVRTLAGSTVAPCFDATLSIDHLGVWRVSVVVVGTDSPPLLGHPILRKLHLLLGPDPKGLSWLVDPRST